VAAPNPFCIARAGVMPNRRRLRIMHDEHVVFRVQQFPRLFVRVEIRATHSVGQFVAGALQRIMNSLRNREKSPAPRE
jgi:hypothetical protein